jgi:hypothetical protein
MENTVILAQYLGLIYVVVSLASLLKPEKLQTFLRSLRRSQAGFFGVGVLLFAFGLLITMLHSDWESFAGIIIGVIGWGAVLESLFYLFLPHRSLAALYAELDSKTVVTASGIVGLGLGISLLLVGLQII